MTELTLEQFILLNFFCLTFNDASRCKELLNAFTALNRFSSTLSTSGFDIDGHTKNNAVSYSEVLGCVFQCSLSELLWTIIVMAKQSFFLQTASNAVEGSGLWEMWLSCI